MLGWRVSATRGPLCPTKTQLCPPVKPLSSVGCTHKRKMTGASPLSPIMKELGMDPRLGWICFCLICLGLRRGPASDPRDCDRPGPGARSPGDQEIIKTAGLLTAHLHRPANTQHTSSRRHRVRDSPGHVDS